MDTTSIALNRTAVQNVNVAQSSTEIKPNEEDQFKKDLVTRIPEKQPAISSDASRLAAVKNDRDNDERSPAITNTKEAQQLIDQLRTESQANPAQHGQAQQNLTSNLVKSLLG